MKKHRALLFQIFSSFSSPGFLQAFAILPLMEFNKRKLQALEIFAQHHWLRPPYWAVEAGFYPIRASYSYLVRLHRWGYLKRKRDYHGRVIYQLAPRGAQWLLARRRGSR